MSEACEQRDTVELAVDAKPHQATGFCENPRKPLTLAPAGVDQKPGGSSAHRCDGFSAVFN
jgi:hypothetical protein